MQERPKRGGELMKDRAGLKNIKAHNLSIIEDTADFETLALFPSNLGTRGRMIVSSSSPLQRVHDIIRRMQSNPNSADCARTCCGALAILSKDEGNKLLIAREGARAVLAAMEIHADRADVQEAACDLIWSLAFESALVKEIVGRLGGVGAVLKALAAHAASPALVKSACGALSNLCQDKVNQASVTTHTQQPNHNNSNSANNNSNSNNNGVKPVLSALQRHRRDAALLPFIFDALASFTVGSEVNALAVGEAGGSALALEAVALHCRRRDVVRSGCHALAILSDVKGQGARLAEDGGVAVLLLALRLHTRFVALHRIAAIVLLRMLQEAPIARPMASGGGVAITLGMLAQHLSEADTVAATVHILYLLTHADVLSSGVDAEVEAHFNGRPPPLPPAATAPLLSAGSGLNGLNGSSGIGRWRPLPVALPADSGDSANNAAPRTNKGTGGVPNGSGNGGNSGTATAAAAAAAANSAGAAGQTGAASSMGANGSLQHEIAASNRELFRGAVALSLTSAMRVHMNRKDIVRAALRTAANLVRFRSVANAFAASPGVAPAVLGSLAAHPGSRGITDSAVAVVHALLETAAGSAVPAQQAKSGSSSVSGNGSGSQSGGRGSMRGSFAAGSSNGSGKGPPSARRESLTSPVVLPCSVNLAALGALFACDGPNLGAAATNATNASPSPSNAATRTMPGVAAAWQASSGAPWHSSAAQGPGSAQVAAWSCSVTGLCAVLLECARREALGGTAARPLNPPLEVASASSTNGTAFSAATGKGSSLVIRPSGAIARRPSLPELVLAALEVCITQWVAALRPPALPNCVLSGPLSGRDRCNMSLAPAPPAGAALEVYAAAGRPGHEKLVEAAREAASAVLGWMAAAPPSWRRKLSFNAYSHGYSSSAGGDASGTDSAHNAATAAIAADAVALPGDDKVRLPPHAIDAACRACEVLLAALAVVAQAESSPAGGTGARSGIGSVGGGSGSGSSKNGFAARDVRLDVAAALRGPTGLAWLAEERIRPLFLELAKAALSQEEAAAMVASVSPPPPPPPPLSAQGGEQPLEPGGSEGSVPTASCEAGAASERPASASRLARGRQGAFASAENTSAVGMVGEQSRNGKGAANTARAAGDRSAAFNFSAPLSRVCPRRPEPFAPRRQASAALLHESAAFTSGNAETASFGAVGGSHGRQNSSNGGASSTGYNSGGAAEATGYGTSLSGVWLAYECPSAAGRGVQSRVVAPEPYPAPLPPPAPRPGPGTPLSAANAGSPFSHSLKFDAAFESANLLRAVQRGPAEYDLFLRPDLHTHGHTQWFYFAVWDTHPPPASSCVGAASKAGPNLDEFPRQGGPCAAASGVGREAASLPTRSRTGDYGDDESVVVFNIVNLTKPDSLFSVGMRPLLYSEAEAAAGGEGWRRCAEQISYRSSNANGNSLGASSAAAWPASGGGWSSSGSGLNGSSNGSGVGGTQFYTLSFSIAFPTRGDRYRLALAYPYTYSDHKRALSELLGNEVTSRHMTAEVLCRTLGGHDCDLLTITESDGASSSGRQPLASIAANELGNAFSNSSGNGYSNGCNGSACPLEKRPCIVVSARVHPGETPASWVMEGMLRFLTGESKEARLLRSMFVFKIVPLLNPDGVIFGNNRCSLAGVDLNRQWRRPSRVLHPTVFHLKQLIRQQQARSEVAMYIDLHGHSRKMNIFMYGVDERRRGSSSSAFVTTAANAAAAGAAAAASIFVAGAIVSVARPPVGGWLRPDVSASGTPGLTTEDHLEGNGAVPLADGAKRPLASSARRFPWLCARGRVARDFLSFRDCSFAVKRGRETTARVVVARELGVRESYTVESTFAGMDFGPLAGFHLTPAHLQLAGAGILEALLDYYAPNRPQSPPEAPPSSAFSHAFAGSPEQLEASHRGSAGSGVLCEATDAVQRPASAVSAVCAASLSASTYLASTTTAPSSDAAAQRPDDEIEGGMPSPERPASGAAATAAVVVQGSQFKGSRQGGLMDAADIEAEYGKAYGAAKEQLESQNDGDANLEDAAIDADNCDDVESESEEASEIEADTEAETGPSGSNEPATDGVAAAAAAASSAAAAEDDDIYGAPAELERENDSGDANLAAPDCFLNGEGMGSVNGTAAADGLCGDDESAPDAEEIAGSDVETATAAADVASAAPAPTEEDGYLFRSEATAAQSSEEEEEDLDGRSTPSDRRRRQPLPRGEEPFLAAREPAPPVLPDGTLLLENRNGFASNGSGSKRNHGAAAGSSNSGGVINRFRGASLLLLPKTSGKELVALDSIPVAMRAPLDGGGGGGGGNNAGNGGSGGAGSSGKKAGSGGKKGSRRGSNSKSASNGGQKGRYAKVKRSTSRGVAAAPYAEPGGPVAALAARRKRAMSLSEAERIKLGLDGPSIATTAAAAAAAAAARFLQADPMALWAPRNDSGRARGSATAARGGSMRWLQEGSALARHVAAQQEQAQMQLSGLASAPASAGAASSGAAVSLGLAGLAGLAGLPRSFSQGGGGADGGGGGRSSGGGGGSTVTAGMLFAPALIDSGRGGMLALPPLPVPGQGERTGVGVTAAEAEAAAVAAAADAVWAKQERRLAAAAAVAVMNHSNRTGGAKRPVKARGSRSKAKL